MNLFCQAMSIIHCVNDNDNIFVKSYASSLLDTLQSKNVGLVGKKCQSNLRNFYLIDLAEKVLVTIVNSLNFSISFELLRV